MGYEHEVPESCAGIEIQRWTFGKKVYKPGKYCVFGKMCIVRLEGEAAICITGSKAENRVLVRYRLDPAYLLQLYRKDADSRALEGRLVPSIISKAAALLLANRLLELSGFEHVRMDARQDFVPFREEIFKPFDDMDAPAKLRFAAEISEALKEQLAIAYGNLFTFVRYSIALVDRCSS